MHRILISLTFFTIASVHSFSQSRLTKRLDSFFHTLPPSQPGIAISIQSQGNITYQNAAGRANPAANATANPASTPDYPLGASTNFRMASLTKQFTGMAILLLDKDRLLSIEDPIGHWLPELPASIGGHVLIRHLLTHTSGIEDYESLIPDTQTTQVSDTDVLQLISRHDSAYFPPGTRFRYSNSGFCLLALIIERAAHQPYAEFIRTHIFLPLHMDHSTVYGNGRLIDQRAMGFAKDSTGAIIPRDQSVTSATKGDGGVYTSLTDYNKWIIALQQNRLIDLSAALNRLRFPINTNSSYAAGWFITGNSQNSILFHSGSTCGFSTYIIQLPADRWSITYFSNMADNSTPFVRILQLLEDSGRKGLSASVGLQDLTR